MKVGLEIHVYPRTSAKMFCMCFVRAEDANTSVCPRCTGQPGAKPMAPNRTAVEKAVVLAKALGCKLEVRATVLRKHYFYPDLPSNYQRTSTPIGREGSFLGVRIREVHVEEDAARYEPRDGTVDYNRAGVPLIEVVTEPDINSTDAAKNFVDEFSRLLHYLKIADPSSAIKADTNVSVGDTRVEVKNINTTHGILAAIEHEAKRQTELLERGGTLVQETRHWDETKGRTLASREKETESDYRYMEDPDLQPIDISSVRVATPEDTFAARKRLERAGVARDAAVAVTEEQEFVALFDSLSKRFEPQRVAEWIRRDLRGELNHRTLTLEQSGVKTKDVERLMDDALSEKITRHKAKQLLRELLDKKESKHTTKASKEDVEKAVEATLLAHQDVVQRYREGKKEAFNFLLGETNRALGFAADPKEIAKVLKEKLNM
ncbi:MAG: Asp-tRNA(Asn)/Glu-tRNA(Gln) amidotransferase subunit GatB [Candidatus Aenigmatarchaeota archaeon]|nr:MAG: Asp-tRNA(Asn)/Glu-tRNA(Gln) amidotransferase subunit GatB [Candidatus Aenigmarchaeota archaeon]